MAQRRQRTYVLGAIAIAIVVILWLLLRGSAYYVNVQSVTGGQLVKGANVTVGGAPVGTIEDIRLTDDNQAELKLKITREDLTPLHRGTTASIRLFSLAGVANRYVSLDPGPNSAAEIASGGVIEADQVLPPVDLDSLLNTFDRKTQKGLRQFLHGSASQYKDDPSTPLNEVAYANAGLRWIAPFFDAGARIAAAVSEDDEMFSQFLVAADRATTTVAGQKEQLAALFTNMNAFAKAVSAESDQLDKALAILPETLRQGTSAFVRLGPAMDALEELSDKSEPISKDLAPLFRKLRPLIENAEPTLHDLRLMIRKGGKSNDATDLLATMPRLTRSARTAFPNSTEAMQKADPVLDFLRPYAPDLTAWMSHFGQIASNYDANGHYARAQTVTNRFHFNKATGELEPRSDKSLSEYPRTGVKRCPGAGTQPATDGSNPFLDNGLDCDPALTPPGP